MKQLALLCLLIFSSLIYAQPPTVGLLKTGAGVTDGYTLFTPDQSKNVYLVNNCGEKINEWSFSEKPGSTCYLLENGTLLRAGRDTLQIRDWNNNIIWTYATSANGLLQHHDIEPLPNGNVLCLLTDNYTNTQMIAMGRDPAITDVNVKLDKVVELQPIGSNGANIVWEWKFSDHFIQDFDNSKQNFGVVVNAPELIDINFDSTFTSDMTHCNAIDYNPGLDQIILSSRNFSEIYIIDHSTTTLEASGHTGGNSTMGGDLLWRWGNPQVYDQGNSLDQQLFKQHDAKWVESGYLDDGKITVFNNGGNGVSSYSSIHLITPQIVGGVYTKISNKFTPLNFEWSWNGSLLGTTVNESKKSGTHSLPNGNFIICETSTGRISEITKTGTHLWTYRNPVGTSTYNQFDVIVSSDNSIFRGEKYPSNYIGFSSQSLTAQGLIENLNTVSDTCILGVGIEDYELTSVSITNPVINDVINFNAGSSFNKIVVIDITGKTVFETSNFVGVRLKINLKPALYFIQLFSDDKMETRKIVVR